MFIYRRERRINFGTGQCARVNVGAEEEKEMLKKKCKLYIFIPKEKIEREFDWFYNVMKIIHISAVIFS